jgi:hypothetical protein
MAFLVGFIQRSYLLSVAAFGRAGFVQFVANKICDARLDKRSKASLRRIHRTQEVPPQAIVNELLRRFFRFRLCAAFACLKFQTDRPPIPREQTFQRREPDIFIRRLSGDDGAPGGWFGEKRLPHE